MVLGRQVPGQFHVQPAVFHQVPFLVRQGPAQADGRVLAAADFIFLVPDPVEQLIPLPLLAVAKAYHRLPLLLQLVHILRLQLFKLCQKQLFFTLLFIPGPDIL